MLVQFVIGVCFYKVGWKVVCVGVGNMDLFVVFGMLVVYGLLLWLWWCVGVGGMYYELYLYFESVVVVIMLVWFGKWLEVCVKCQIVQVICVLQVLCFDIVCVCSVDGMLCDIFVVQVCVGDVVFVCVGECIFVDVVVLEGVSYVDEFMLIGESLFVFKYEGDYVIVGVIVMDGVLFVCIMVIGVDIMFLCIICFVEDVQVVKLLIQ